MSSLPEQFSHVSAVSSVEPAPPAWVEKNIGQAQLRTIDPNFLIALESRFTPTASFIKARVRHANALPPGRLELATRDAYLAIAGQLSTLPASHAVRFWNYIPGIHQSSGTGSDGEALDRYMVFNAGRYQACKNWLGGEAAFSRLLATASGVGHQGTDLVIHALALVEPGLAIENPRQVPAYHYSRRYGPRPPCFARATRVTLKDQPIVLVGGTASVRGEQSVHVGDLHAQFQETLINLTALLRASDIQADAAQTNGVAEETVLLRRFTHVRVYYVRPTDLPSLQAACSAAFESAHVEYVLADLCRQDLLVEIEGIALASEPILLK